MLILSTLALLVFPSILLQRLAVENIVFFEDLEKRKAPLFHLCIDFICNWTNSAQWSFYAGPRQLTKRKYTPLTGRRQGRDAPESWQSQGHV